MIRLFTPLCCFLLFICILLNDFMIVAVVPAHEDNGLVGRRACLQIICSVDKIVQDGSQV